MGYDNNWNRDVGYGVPCLCDYPRCKKEIDRGLACVCGGDVYGGEYGCGLFFCGKHLFSKYIKEINGYIFVCPRCLKNKPPYNPKPDIEEWIKWKLEHESWGLWRKDNPKEVEKLMKQLKI